MYFCEKFVIRAFLFVVFSCLTPVSFADISFTSANFTAQEDSGVITVSANLTAGCVFGECYETILIDYSVTAGTATAGVDFTAVSGTLSWTANGIQSFQIPIVADADIEADESLVVTLSNCLQQFSAPSPSSITCNRDVFDLPASATILNDDFPAPGTLSLTSSTVNVTEGSVATVSVTRTGGSDGAISIDYASSDITALAASDYSSVSGSLSWADGEAGVKSITIATLVDTIIEVDESFAVTLSNLIGGATLSSGSTATVTITNAIGELEGLTPNQKEVAEEIDKICEGATGDLLLRCQDLLDSGLSNEELIQAIDSMTPEQVSSQGSIANDFGFQQLKMVHGRIVSLRQAPGAASRISVTGFNLNSFGQNIPVGQIAQALIYNALGGGSGDEPLRDLPLGFFIKGQVDIGNKKSSNFEKGFDVDTKSITLGFDYQFTDQLLIGIASGYGHSDTEFDSNAGDMESHSGNFSIYGSYYLPKDFYMDAILSYSINDYDSSRNIAFTGFQGTASSTPFGTQYGGSLGFGKDFYIRSFFFSPYIRAEYLSTGIDEYSEQGGGGLALRISEQSMDSFTSTVGGQLSHAISMPWGVISPGLRFEWRHQYRDDQRTIQFQLIDAPAGTGRFAIKTDDPDRDYFNLGASVAVTLPEGRSAFIRYETRLGQRDMTNHTIEAAVRMPF